MNSASLLEIVRQKLPTNAIEFRENCLYYTKKEISVGELSVALRTENRRILDYFRKQGKIIDKNQELPYDWLEDYCQSRRIKLKKKTSVNFCEIIEDYLAAIDKNTPLSERPPIVSIMGHVDHGKTTLLDTIRHTHFQEKEVGGITQKITVSPIDFSGQKIIFLDTPGHRDFIKLRQRGVALTDIVVLVINASDGVMPQTVEIIDHLRENKLPTIVFINHKKPTETDNETHLNKIKTQLQEKQLTPLEWGGETIVVSGNAKEKTSIDHLCESILLLADYKANWERPANGIVIDSYLHQSGALSTELLVMGGTLKEKDEIFLGGKIAPAKIIFNSQGQRINQAFPGDLVRIIGLNFAAELGDKFLVVEDNKTKKEIEKKISNYLSKRGQLGFSLTSEKKNVNLFLLADSQNSLEVLNKLVEKMSNSNISFSVINSSVGKLSNSDLNLAKITSSTILVFGFNFPPAQEKILRENNIPFFGSKIIYEIEEKLEQIITGNQEKRKVEKEYGVAKITKVFDFSGGNIAGCLVISGKISRNNRVRVLQGKQDTTVFTGEIKSLESKNESKSEVISGQECGIVLKGFDKFQVGDKIVAFQIVEENISAKK
jgi:translation initiation factor IF-2